MKVREIRVMARQLGIQKYWRLRKPDLIRAVQSAEGNDACFARNGGYCQQEECLWRADCLACQQSAEYTATGSTSHGH